tara:strand:+ start:2331 stop:2654 length:324 start_codon:yes stop_codon:yes gene_type:complete
MDSSHHRKEEGAISRTGARSSVGKVSYFTSSFIAILFLFALKTRLVLSELLFKSFLSNSLLDTNSAAVEFGEAVLIYRLTLTVSSACELAPYPAPEALYRCARLNTI